MSSTYTICLDSSAADFCWFIQKNGDQIGHVLEVEGDDATDEQLYAAFAVEVSNDKPDIRRW